MDILKLIEEVGINNLLFITNMEQIRTYFGMISLTSSSDPDILVLCKIDETKYKIKDGYKIRLKALDQKIGISAYTDYYISDLDSLINDGQISVLKVLNHLIIKNDEK